MKKAMIVDNRYAKTAEKYWGKRFTIIPSLNNASLPEPISAHPDMSLFPIGKKHFICAPEVAGDYEKLLSPHGAKIICGEKKLSCNYPGDIAYNILRVGNYAFAHFSEADGKICEFFKQNGIKMIDVAQGYAKCSSCVFSNSVITADQSILKAAKNALCRTLLIPPGEIELPGYNYGFIGGASGTPDDKEIFFFGDIFLLSSGEKISDFILENGGKINYIAGMPLIDAGTIMFV